MPQNVLELYEVVEEIGKGAFGIVTKVRRKDNGRIFARKEINFGSMTEQDVLQLMTEVHVLEHIKHDHIIYYQERYVDVESKRLYIVTEYCAGGDLSAIILRAVKQKKYITEDTVWTYFMQILSALEYCHNTGEGRSDVNWKGQILHRDLKPANVLLDQFNTVKLGDFGLAKVLPEGRFGDTFAGTPYYMSPEMIQGTIYNHKSDIWSLGCLIYHLCVLRPLFHQAESQDELNKLIQGAEIPSLPKYYTQSLNDIVQTMLVRNPEMRPSAAALLKHERIQFSMERRDLIIHKSKLEEIELAIDDTMRNKNAEIDSLRQHKLITPEVLQAALDRQEAEMYAILQAKQQEMKDAFQRRETELIEALDKREETMRLTRARLENLVTSNGARCAFSQY
ncbi:kinase-like domain-containing protein [Mycena leptocephala]|nr:kinase-like domain-containing protein [Mycena leptocephala]